MVNVDVRVTTRMNGTTVPRLYQYATHTDLQTPAVLGTTSLYLERTVHFLERYALLLIVCTLAAVTFFMKAAGP